MGGKIMHDDRVIPAQAVGTLVFAALSSLWLPACDSASPEPQVVRTDSAGVELVRYAGLPAVPEWTVDVDSFLSIGVAEGDAPYELSSVTSVDGTSDGHIVVAETGTREIRIFDENGRFIRTLGRSGEGPGEFGWLDWSVVMPGDSILAWDGRLRRLTVFAPTGEVSRIERVSVAGAHLWMSEDGFPDGSLLIVMIEDAAGTYATLDPVDSAGPQPLLTMSERGIYTDQEGRFWSIPFMPRHAVTLSPDRVYATSGEAFSFRGYRLDGPLAIDVSVGYAPRPITPEEIATYKAERRAELREREERAAQRGMVINQPPLDDLPYPDVYPVLDDIRTDAEGMIWVREYVPADSAPQTWHVFDRAGEYRARVRLPSGLHVLEIERDAIYGRWTDELGVRSARVYPLSRGT
jgi:hypothetical protein